MPSFRNNEICKDLELGISQEKLYFHLGMPVSSSGRNFAFTAGGGESLITATINNSKVVKLECGT